MLELLEIEQPALRQSLLALISILVSTLKGIEYMMTNGKDILVRLIQIMKELGEQQENTTNPVANSVILRFLVAILQKMSIWHELIPVFI